jgi:hypothetical protein
MAAVFAIILGLFGKFGAILQPFRPRHGRRIHSSLRYDRFHRMRTLRKRIWTSLIQESDRCGADPGNRPWPFQRIAIGNVNISGLFLAVLVGSLQIKSFPKLYNTDSKTIQKILPKREGFFYAKNRRQKTFCRRVFVIRLRRGEVQDDGHV